MQVKIIAESYKGSILQYFRPPLSYNLALDLTFVFCWVAALHRFYRILRFRSAVRFNSSKMEWKHIKVSKFIV